MPIYPSKPTVPVLNRNHPLAAGLVWALPFCEGGGNTRDAIAQRLGTANGVAWVRTPFGMGVDLSSSAYFDLSGLVILETGKPFTLVWWEYVLQDANLYPSRFRLPVKNSTYNGMIVIRSNDTANSYNTIVAGMSPPGGFTARASGAPSLANCVGQWKMWTISSSRGADAQATDKWAISCDGVFYSITTGGAFNTQNNTTARVGWDGLDYSADCIMAGAMCYNRVLTQREINTLYTDPWAIYRPRRKAIFFPAQESAPISNTGMVFSRFV